MKYTYNLFYVLGYREEKNNSILFNLFEFLYKILIRIK